MASVTIAPIPRVIAAVARVGFDHGWLCLSPTFLNLQLPVLLIDRRLLPDPTLLGLEPFGIRDPRLPLPTTRIVVQHHPDAMISIWSHHPGHPSAQLLGWHQATPTYDTQHASWARDGGRVSRAVVIIGDTHRIQLCWAAVWDSHIGHAQLIDTAQQIVSRAGTGEPDARLVTVAVTGLGGPAGSEVHSVPNRVQNMHLRPNM